MQVKGTEWKFGLILKEKKRKERKEKEKRKGIILYIVAQQVELHCTGK